MMTPLYTATARIQIDRDGRNIVDQGRNVDPTARFDYDFMKTQIELLQSRAIAERVASRLNLANDTDLLSRKAHPLRVRSAARCRRSFRLREPKRQPRRRPNSNARPLASFRATVPYDRCRGRGSSMSSTRIPIPLAPSASPWPMSRPTSPPPSTSALRPMPMPRPFWKTRSSS